MKMKRYLFEPQYKRSLMATKRWIAFTKSQSRYAYFITLTYFGGRKEAPENDVVPFCINLSNILKQEIYVDGVYWDWNEDSRKHSHIHLIVGCCSEIQSPVVKVAWNKGILQVKPYDHDLNGFYYLIKGGNKLPHLPYPFKNHVFKPSQQRRRRFK